MNRLTLALLAAIEAIVVVAIGVGVPFVCALVFSGVELGFTGEPITLWRAAADVWLLGHGVPLSIGLDAATIRSVGVPQNFAVFTLSVPPLMIGVWTAFAAMRTARRCVSRQWITVIPVSLVVVVAASTFIALTASVTGAGPSLGAAVVLPAAIYLGGAVVGLVVNARSGRIEVNIDGFGGFAERLFSRLPAVVPDVFRAAARTCGVFLLAMISVAALAFTVSLLANFSTVIALYESTDYGVVGGILVTVLHLVFVPTLLVWTMSWLFGPGFAFGADTIIAPFVTQVGPLPSVPVLGAIPGWDSPIGLIVVFIPVAAAATGALYARRRAAAEIAGASATLRLVVVGGSALLIGIVVLALTALTSGSVGPGVLTVVGPHPWLVSSAATVIALVGCGAVWASPPNRFLDGDGNDRSIGTASA